MDHTESLLKSLFVMATLVEARDPYTGGHLWRVSQFSRLLADASGLPEQDGIRIMLGGFLHDLGKVGVPDAILNKRDRLTDEEYEVIKTHPEVGFRILTDHPLANLVEHAVLMHHERPDGRGYPQGLSGDAVPVSARIVGICDAFDAMTSTRPYRTGMPTSVALGLIEEQLGSQFDREIGQTFLQLGRQGQLDHIVGHSEAGIPIMCCPGCNAPMVRTRRHRRHDPLYCRNCGGESALDLDDGGAQLKPTGQRGGPAQLVPDVDHDLLDQLIGLATDYLRSPTRDRGWLSRLLPS